MKKELEQKLIEKHRYMFSNYEEQKLRMKKHLALSSKIGKANQENNQEKLDQLRKESKDVGPFEPIAFGCECDDGWYDLLDELMEKIQEIDTAQTLRITQIKEKFGGLRFYTNGGGIRLDILGDSSYQLDTDKEHEKINNLISEYEDKSYKICEVCGEPGKLCSSGYWLKTVCKAHRTYSPWPGEEANPPYLPSSPFHVDLRVVVNDEYLANIQSIAFDESEDTWVYTLDNGSSFFESDLKRIPWSKFAPDWAVTYEDVPNTEFKVVHKEYVPKEGWFYDIENQESKEVLRSRPELSLKIIKDSNGHIKSFEKEESNATEGSK